MTNYNRSEGGQQLENVVPMPLPFNDNCINDESLSAARADELNEKFTNNFLPPGYSFNDGWLMFQREAEGDSVKPLGRVCTKLEIIACTRDQFGENHGRLLQFNDLDGVQHRWAMPMALLAGDGNGYRQELLSKGLLIEPNRWARQHLTNYIQSSFPPNKARCVQTTGWHNDGAVFVFPNGIIGNESDEPLILQRSTSFSSVCTAAGTLEEWQQVAKLCIGNSRLIFAVSASFASPLLALLGEENGGIHFRGGSSSGKTTCLRAAASVWGGNDYVQQWRATSNGLEGTAAAHNDCLLCLDEMGQVDPSEVGNIAYMLANGMGKIRNDKNLDNRKNKCWRLIFLSSGEISLSNHMKEGNKRVKAGQEIRVLDIPADGQAYGCFSELHGYGQGHLFAEYIGGLCKSYHGTAGVAFIERLIPIRKKIIEHCRAHIRELAKENVPMTASGQVCRAFNRFALIAVAGELAISLGIVDWQEGAAIEAALICFNDWLKARGDIGPLEEREILSHVRHFFEQHGDSRFTPWDNSDGKTTHMRAGYRKLVNGTQEFFVFTESFRRDICVGSQPENVAKVCLAHEWIMPGPDGGATRSERLPGAKGSTRVYRFTSKALSDEEDDTL